MKALTLPDPKTDRYDAAHSANLSTNVVGGSGFTDSVRLTETIQHFHIKGSPQRLPFSFPDLDQTT